MYLSALSYNTPVFEYVSLSTVIQWNEMLPKKQLAFPYRVMVVNLSIVAEPQERKLLDA